jgi:hypothetical protein
MTVEKKQVNRWLRALGIAKVLFVDEGYHTAYLEEIEALIKAEVRHETTTPHQGQRAARKRLDICLHQPRPGGVPDRVGQARIHL